MGFITYPRTAAEIGYILSLGYKEILKLLKLKKLRLNLKSYLQYLFKNQNFTDTDLQNLNNKLLLWKQKREKAGLASSAMVYHHTGAYILHGFTIKKFLYTRKKDRDIYKREREKEFGPIRKLWLKQIAIKYRDELMAAGIPPYEIDKMAKTGKTPLDNNGKTYQVHHRIPLDDGGTNSIENFILIRNDIEHRAIHGYYNPAELRIDGLSYGSSAWVALPMPPEDTIVYPNPALDYVAEKVPNVDFLEIYHDD